MIDTFKYVHEIYSAEKPKLEEQDPEIGTRGNTKKLKGHNVKCDARKFFFSERVVETWNSLPDSVVDAPSVNAFKRRLDTFWQNKIEMYNPSCQ